MALRVSPLVGVVVMRCTHYYVGRLLSELLRTTPERACPRRCNEPIDVRNLSSGADERRNL